MRAMRLLERTTLVSAVGSWTCVDSAPSSNLSSQLPIVDLGYQRHQAYEFNQDGGYLNFTNIPYALPPTGERRFRAPVPINSTSKIIHRGSIGHICPQAVPGWTLAQDSISVPTGPDPRISEDCLVLDVLVPERVWDKVSRGQNPNAAVLVWIYGGGFFFGSKDAWGDPVGLMEASKSGGEDGIIYVAMNYRVGAFGFLSGPSLTEDGDSNAGLLDQRLALQWIQQNIHLFGGAKDRVTIMGESAGGGSVLQHLTAYGAIVGPAPFSRAILQSPGAYYIPGSQQQGDILQAFLALLNVSSVGEARRLTSSALIAANTAQINAAAPGVSPFGPAPDGRFMPALPTQLLAQGYHYPNISVLVSHTANEGALLVPPLFRNTTSNSSAALFVQLIRSYYPSISASNMRHITQTLYPAIYDGTYPYTSEFDRAALFAGDTSLKSNANAVRIAYGETAFAYEFAIGSGLHASDVPYMFHNKRVPNPAVQYPEHAARLQKLLTNFVISGVAQVEDDGFNVTLPRYSDGMRVMRIADDGWEEVADLTSNERSAWWQKGLGKLDLF